METLEKVTKPAEIEVVLRGVEGEVLICDPCYYTEDGTRDPGDLGYRFDGTGDWRVSTSYLDEGSWGLRTSELTATRMGAVRGAGGEQQVRRLAVDAGLMAFIPVESGRVRDWTAFCDELEKLGHYDGSRVAQPLAVDGRAVSSTGYGDGEYPCFVTYDTDGGVAEVRVAFLDEEEDESPWD